MTVKYETTCPFCKTDLSFRITKKELAEGIKDVTIACSKCKNEFVVEISKKSNFRYGFIFFMFLFGIYFYMHYQDPSLPTNVESVSILDSGADSLDSAKKSIVFVKYDFTGKNLDGGYFENTATGSGVIYSNQNSKLLVFTNRHVIDCGFNEINCYQRLSEKVSIRTQDGNIYSVSKIMLAPHDLDIAILEINDENSKDYEVAPINHYIKMGDKVTAIGYPAYAERVLEFSVSSGQVNQLKDLLMSDGFAFESIESDAYTYFGSSGGGLFDENANLVGINTWVNIGTPYQRSTAIKLSSLNNIDSFNYCDKSSYSSKNYCLKYCNRNEVLGKDDVCYDPCEGFYCQTILSSVNDRRCKDAGYVLGSDGYCHLPCGSGYCGDSTSICYKNRCISCQINTYLFKDGTCRYSE